jgi:cytochrome P450
VFLSDPGDVAELLLAPVDELSPAGGGGPILPIVGERSFMLEEGEEHQIGRLVALGAFSQRAVQAHTDAVAAVLDRGLRSLPTEVPVALHPRLRELTLEVVLRRIFGDGIDEETIMLLRERILAMLEITASVTLTKNLMRHGPGRRTWERFLTARDDVDELVYGLIEKRGDPREHGEGDALDRLLAARNADGSRLSRRQLRDNVISLVLAGHETTASQLAWAFQLLAHHPRVQARLVEEIDRGESGEYLDATILEVLRHRPVFLFTIPRAVMREGVWIGGWTFGPPAQLLGCIYLIHHDPVLYPEPDVFSPERFLGEPPGGDAWIPWGGARRRCPGRHMALFEMKTILRGILSRMNVEPASRQMERPRWRSVIVTPHAGSRVILRPRVRAARVTHPTPVATAGQESRAFFYSEN